MPLLEIIKYSRGNDSYYCLRLDGRTIDNSIVYIHPLDKEMSAKIINEYFNRVRLNGSLYTETVIAQETIPQIENHAELQD